MSMKNKNTYIPITVNKNTKSGGEYKKTSTSNAISTYQGGFLGKILGQGVNAKTNIVGVATIILVLTICLGWGLGGNEPPNSITVVLSTLFGYFIANKKSDG